MIKKLFLWIIILSFLGLAYYLGGDYKAYQLSTHYHANFWVFIDGKRIDFSDDKYMEDIAACKVGVQKSAKDRVHLHENNMGTIHVHDDGVTWWHFFSNIGYNFTSQSITDDEGKTWNTDGEKKLLFFINGKEVKNPFNTEIRSEDVLMISYGTSNAPDVLKNFEPIIKKDAKEYNQKNDPSTCSGNEYNFFKNLHDMFGKHSH